MVLKVKEDKVSIWCEGYGKGRIGYVSKGVPEGAEIVAKDIVAQRFSEDEKGRKQGICDMYCFVLEHEDNVGKRKRYKNEEVIGKYQGRDVYRYLDKRTVYEDDEKVQETSYYPDGKPLCVSNFIDGICRTSIHYGIDEMRICHYDANEKYEKESCIPYVSNEWEKEKNATRLTETVAKGVREGNGVLQKSSPQH